MLDYKNLKNLSESEQMRMDENYRLKRKEVIYIE